MLSQSVGYAATALGYVAAAGGKPLLVKEMAEACEIPAPYLAKIINALARKQIVATQRGVGGGVSLARPAEEISLFQLCVALDDAIVQARCMLGTAECSDERACPAHKFWTAHRGRQVEFLKATSVADIAAFETRRRWRRGPAYGHSHGHAHTQALPVRSIGPAAAPAAPTHESTDAPAK